MKTIFDVYVPMEDQAQCDRMKQVCVDAGLRIWKYSIAFVFILKGDVLAYSKPSKQFFIMRLGDYNLVCPEDVKTQVTEVEFLTLLNEYKSKENGNVLL